MNHLLVILILPFLVKAQYDSYTEGRIMVHLFEWPYRDVAEECENFILSYGYGGVQISPPNEALVLFNEDFKYPWWQSWQPVSYKIENIFGTEAEFRDMVRRCNAVGVPVYADVCIQQMTGADWPPGTHSSGSSSFNSLTQDYPGVPYISDDFNDDFCTTSSGMVEPNSTAEEMRNCKLYNLNDLNLGKEYVRDQISGFLNNLIDAGMAGFLCSACKYIWPDQLKIVTDSLNDLNTDYFEPGSRPFFYQEVIDLGGEPVTADEYFATGRVTELKYSEGMGRLFRGIDGETLSDLRTYEEDYELMPTEYAFVFIDNHDNQRGHGSGGGTILNYKDGKLYRLAIAYTLANPYGYPRIISSFEFDNGDQGPPMDGDYVIQSPRNDVTGNCSQGWVCEHRWRQFYNMAVFRNTVGDEPVINWWDNGGNKVAFSRGTSGFFAMNNDTTDFSETLQTGLEEGIYCDMISGHLGDASCSGKMVIVQADGTASINIGVDEEDSMLAIHKDSKLF